MSATTATPVISNLIQQYQQAATAAKQTQAEAEQAELARIEAIILAALRPFGDELVKVEGTDFAFRADRSQPMLFQRAGWLVRLAGWAPHYSFYVGWASNGRGWQEQVYFSSSNERSYQTSPQYFTTLADKESLPIFIVAQQEAYEERLAKYQKEQAEKRDGRISAAKNALSSTHPYYRAGSEEQAIKAFNVLMEELPEQAANNQARLKEWQVWFTEMQAQEVRKAERVAQLEADKAAYIEAYRVYATAENEVFAFNKGMLPLIQLELDETTFTTWTLTYGVMGYNEDEQVNDVDSRQVEVLACEPDSNGYWPVVDRYTGFIAPMKYYNLVSLSGPQERKASEMRFVKRHHAMGSRDDDDNFLCYPPTSNLLPLIEQRLGEMLRPLPQEPDPTAFGLVAELSTDSLRQLQAEARGDNFPF